MPSFSIALSGLSADSVALNTIGNNLANLNTTAFKEQSTEFENLFYQQIGINGSGDALQVGAGTKVASTTTDYSQGSIDPTSGVSSNLALSGDGYFVVNGGGANELTRAGNFQLDASGNLITSNGASVMGYAAVNGVVGSNSTLAALQLPVGTAEAAKATQNLSLTANLNAGASIGTPYPTSVTIYDSLGQQHLANIVFTKTAANTWSYAVTLPAGDATGTPTNNTGSLTFDSSGNLLTPTGNITGMTFPTLTDGAADINLNLNLYNSGVPTITQTAAASQQNANAQDGFASGIYTGFTANSAGVISATFSNGQTENIGQVAVATVANNEGLTVVGNNDFMTTAASGLAAVGVAGTGSRGTITDSALELSNVDISTEFADLIVAQRAFEANSKTVTTFDTVTQDTIAMIR